MSITRIQVRRGLASQWAAPGTVILAPGEFGFETDTNNFKIGDGSKTWNQLSYFKNVEKLNNVTENNLTNYAKTSQLADYVLSSRIGSASGVASLDSNGQIPITQLQNIIDGADESLNTLNEIAQALLDDETGLDALLTEIDKKLSKTGGIISGNLVVETGSNDTVGQVTANRIRVLSSSDVSDFSTDHAFQIGADSQPKLKINSSKIQALGSSNNETSLLEIQPIGGSTSFGGSILANSSGASLQVGTGGISTTGKISSIQPIVDISSNHTAVPTNKFALIRSTGSAVNVTINSTSLAKGERMDFVQWGTGQITFVASGVTLGSNGITKLKTNGQYAAVSLIKVDDTTGYLLVGNLVA